MISRAGLGSRAEARQWIAGGRVAVNGKKIQTPDHWVDMARDKVTLDGKPIDAPKKIYLLLYKPKGYITTYKDPEGRKTVYDLISDVKTFVSTVGRLDQDTSGLLILTNDTDFAGFVTSPESKVPKTYLVKASTLLADAELDQLRRGVELDDGPTRPAIVNRIRDAATSTFFDITITEGRNRQVRRMVEFLGSEDKSVKVRKLVRTHIGPIAIGDLQIGTYRELTERELQQLSGSSGSKPAPRPDTRSQPTNASTRSRRRS